MITINTPTGVWANEYIPSRNVRVPTWSASADLGTPGFWHTGGFPSGHHPIQNAANTHYVALLHASGVYHDYN